MVKNEARKKWLFLALQFQKEPGMAQENAKSKVFGAKIHEESINHDFIALCQAVLPEIDDLCKLPSEQHPEKVPITTL